MRLHPLALAAATAVARRLTALAAGVAGAAPGGPTDRSTGSRRRSWSLPCVTEPSTSRPIRCSSANRSCSSRASTAAVAGPWRPASTVTSSVRLPVRVRVVRQPVTEVIAVGTGVPDTADRHRPGVGPARRVRVRRRLGDLRPAMATTAGSSSPPSTWSGLGGSGLPHEHSREEQIRLATILRDQSGGYGAWPSCAAQLGLPDR